MTLKIIGPGFGRTGTYSLKTALEHLGFGPCHHMGELVANPKLIPDWQLVCKKYPSDWNKLFDGFHSQLDWPGVHVWRSLVDYYPDAKVVLTVRDASDWYSSFEKTIVPFIEKNGNHSSSVKNMIASLCIDLYVTNTFADRLRDRTYMEKQFEEHIKEVEAFVPSKRLLKFNVKQGWEPLCEFLGVTVPDTPFYNTNSRKEFIDWMDD